MKNALFLGGIFLAVIAACDNSKKQTQPEDPDYETDPARIPLRGLCPASTRLGGFWVHAGDTYTVFEGLVREAPAPALGPRVQLESGGCRLLAPRNAFCDPACSPGEYCDDTASPAVCRTMPAGRDAGRVVVRGLNQRLEVSALPPNYNYVYNRIDHPGIVPGQVVHLYAQNGFLDFFELYGLGVDPIGAEPSKVTLVRGQDLHLQWSPGFSERAQVQFEMSVDQHGLEPWTLSCVFPDTGEGTVPAAVVDALLSAGVSGYPVGTVLRRSVDAVELSAGCVDFSVISARSLTVEVAGRTPCMRNDDCPPPQLCDTTPTVQQCYTPCTQPEECTPPETCSARGRCE